MFWEVSSTCCETFLKGLPKLDHFLNCVIPSVWNKMTTNNVVPKRWRCSQFLPAAGGSPVLPNQVKAAQNSSDACCLSRYLDLMLVTSSALHLDSHFYAPLPDNDVIIHLILSYKPILFLLHCSEFRVTVQVNKYNFISSERDRLGEEKPMDASCRTEREDMIATLQTGLWRAESHAVPPPSLLSLSLTGSSSVKWGFFTIRPDKLT